MKHSNLQLFLLSCLLLLISCDKQDNPSGAWSESVFIINEGQFPTGTGSVSAFNRETLDVTNDLFETANGRPLGNIVQSLAVVKDKAFIVVNNANKIEVVNLEDFKSVATIENITLPRYFIKLNDSRGYVSCWDSTVKVIDLADYSVLSSVQTGTGPDEMVLAGNYLFVVNSGVFGVDDSTVSVIRTDTHESIARIEVGHRPSGIQKDFNGNVWVLCSGRGFQGYPSPDDTPARLVCIEPETRAVIKEINFSDPGIHPDQLIINETENILYYNHPDGIFAFPITASSLNTMPLIAAGKFYYGLGYDNVEKHIYATDPLDYQQNGWVFRFNSTDGSPAGSFMAGVVPNGFWFNR